MGVITDMSRSTSHNGRRYMMFAGLGLAGLVAGAGTEPGLRSVAQFAVAYPIGALLGAGIRGPSSPVPCSFSDSLERDEGTLIGYRVLMATYAVGALGRMCFNG